MAKKMLIDATHAEETRVVVVDGNKIEEFDFESENKRQLAGNIYLAKVTRVEPSLQAAFVDYGGNRHGFLAFSEIHPDYYQIPVADREALLEEERAYAEAQKARDEEEDKPKPKRRRRSRSKAAKAQNDDAVTTSEEITGMETIDLDDGDEEVSPAASDNEAEGNDAEAKSESTDQSASDDEKDAPSSDASDENAEEAEKAGEGDSANSDEKADDEAVEAEADDVAPDAAEKDEDIESVADDDDEEDIRAPRKPRSRRYKIQ
ncbi:MAG: ribonuclease E/G, partial [Pseudomonadota bacterium]